MNYDNTKINYGNETLVYLLSSLGKNQKFVIEIAFRELVYADDRIEYFSVIKRSMCLITVRNSVMGGTLNSQVEYHCDIN